MLKEELQLLQEAGSYVGEVVKVMGKSKVLVKVWLQLFQNFLCHHALIISRVEHFEPMFCTSFYELRL